MLGIGNVANRALSNAGIQREPFSYTKGKGVTKCNTGVAPSTCKQGKWPVIGK